MARHPLISAITVRSRRDRRGAPIADLAAGPRLS